MKKINKIPHIMKEDHYWSLFAHSMCEKGQLQRGLGHVDQVKLCNRWRCGLLVNIVSSSDCVTLVKHL